MRDEKTNNLDSVLTTDVFFRYVAYNRSDILVGWEIVGIRKYIENNDILCLVFILYLVKIKDFLKLSEDNISTKSHLR